MLAGAGAVLGLGLSYGLIFWLARQGSIALPLLSSVRVDGPALLWTLAVTLVAAILFALVPGLRASGANVQDALKDSGHGISTGRGHERVRAALVVTEVALACVLLIGAGLLLRSFLNVIDVDLGFRPEQAAVIKINYNDGGSGQRRGAVLREIQRNVLSIPGIQAAESRTCCRSGAIEAGA